MTVKELIELLGEYPGDYPVVLEAEGYRGEVKAVMKGGIVGGSGVLLTDEE